MNENCLCVLVVTKTAKVSVSGVGLGLDHAGLGLGLGLGLPGLDNMSASPFQEAGPHRAFMFLGYLLLISHHLTSN